MNVKKSPKMSDLRGSIQGFKASGKSKSSADLYAGLDDLFKSKKQGLIDDEKYISEKTSIIEKIIENADISRENTYRYAGELFKKGALDSDEYNLLIRAVSGEADNIVPVEQNSAEVLPVPENTLLSRFKDNFLRLLIGINVAVPDSRSRSGYRISWGLLLLQTMNLIVCCILLYLSVISAVLAFIVIFYVASRLFKKL